MKTGISSLLFLVLALAISSCGKDGVDKDGNCTQGIKDDYKNLIETTERANASRIGERKARMEEALRVCQDFKSKYNDVQCRYDSEREMRTSMIDCNQIKKLVDMLR